MKKINCFGDICPVPMIKLQNTLESMDTNDSVMIVVDHSCVTESIKEYYKVSKYNIVIDEVIDGVWEITVSKKN